MGKGSETGIVAKTLHFVFEFIRQIQIMI